MKMMKSVLFGLVLGFVGAQTCKKDCCLYTGSKVKPRELTVKITGNNCSESNNSDNDFIDNECIDYQPINSNNIFVVVTEANDKDKACSEESFFSKNVTINSEHTFAVTQETYFYLFSDDCGSTLLQEFSMHLSCSVDIFTGDTFGAVELSECNSEGPTPSDGDDCCDNQFSEPQQWVLKVTGNDCGNVTDVKTIHEDFLCTGNSSFDFPVFVRVSDNDDGPCDTSAILFEGLVNNNSEIVVTKKGVPGYIYFFNDEPSNINCDSPVQAMRFHTSCSQPFPLGQSFGGIDVAECRATAVPESGVDCCKVFNEVNQFVFTFTGENCTKFESTSDKFSCIDSGTFSTTESSYYKVTDDHFLGDTCEDGVIFFEGTVSVNDEIVVNSLPNDAFIHFYTNSSTCDLIQSIKLHTSCSAPLVLDAYFGGVQLTRCEENAVPQPGQDCCGNDFQVREWVFEVTGNDCGNVTDVKTIHEDFLCTGNSSFDFPVFVRVSDNDDGPCDTSAILFEGLVNNNSEIVVTPTQEGKVPEHIYFFNDVPNDSNCGSPVQAMTFHQSCSQQFPLGQSFGGIDVAGCRAQALGCEVVDTCDKICTSPKTELNEDCECECPADANSCTPDGDTVFFDAGSCLCKCSNQSLDYPNCTSPPVLDECAQQDLCNVCECSRRKYRSRRRKLTYGGFAPSCDLEPYSNCNCCGGIPS